MRLHDTVEISTMITKCLQDEKAKHGVTTHPTTYSTTANNLFTTTGPTTGLSSTQPPPTSSLDRFAAREQITLQQQLLKDCQALIVSFQRDLNSCPDPFGIRSSPPDQLLIRLRDIVGNPMPLSPTDSLLFLNRLQQSENELLKAREKLDLMVVDLISNENQRDSAQKAQKEAEEKNAKLQSELTLLRQQVEAKEKDVEMWKRLAESSCGNTRGVDSTSQPFPSRTYLPSLSSLAGAGAGAGATTATATSNALNRYGGSHSSTTTTTTAMPGFIHYPYENITGVTGQRMYVWRKGTVMTRIPHSRSDVEPIMRTVRDKVIQLSELQRLRS